MNSIAHSVNTVSPAPPPQKRHRFGVWGDITRADARNSSAVQLEATVWSLTASLEETDHEPTRDYLAYQLTIYRDELRLRERIDDPIRPLRPQAARYDLDRIKDTYPLPEALERLASMQLRKRGSHWVGRCPFADHDDTNPSFVVSGDGRLWRCWGCDRSGDVFSFASEWYGARSFIGTVDLLVTALGGRLDEFREQPGRPPLRIIFTGEGKGDE